VRRGLSPFGLMALVFGFAFLYVPIVLLVIYSFNASRLVTVWGGWSLHWYGALLDDGQMLDSARMSLSVAVSAATLATLFGTLAALALARFGRFRGRAAFAALLYAPLVLPEVIIGLSLLLLFVALGVDRGFGTVVLGHATLGACFVAVVVHAKLVTLDRSLEEAAADLGAAPASVFVAITLPLAAPAVVAGFLLASILSLDDLVIASFTSGPGATTLPMRIYSSVRLGVTPEINAISTILLALVGLALLAGVLLTRVRKDAG
jgi:putrescine transport system permease protein